MDVTSCVAALGVPDEAGVESFPCGDGVFSPLSAAILASDLCLLAPSMSLWLAPSSFSSPSSSSLPDSELESDELLEELEDLGGGREE